MSYILSLVRNTSHSSLLLYYLFCLNIIFIAVKATVSSDVQIRGIRHYYNVTISKDFKTDIAINTTMELTTGKDSGVCGVANIHKGSTYIFTGSVTPDKKLSINICGFNKEYNGLSKTIKNGFESKEYDCRCSICVGTECDGNGQAHCALPDGWSDAGYLNRCCSHRRENTNSEKIECGWSDPATY